jgi:hypothetical protein
VLKARFTHSLGGFIHTFPTGNYPSEQGFSSLYTDLTSGYYYYLYIKKTHPQTNPTDISTLTQVSSGPTAVKDFQLKKKRVNA